MIQRKVLFILCLLHILPRIYAQEVWTVSNTGLPIDFSILDFAVMNDKIYASGTVSNDTARIYTSVDHGENWVALTNTTLNSYSAATAILTHQGKLFLSANKGTAANTLLVSSDQGQTWTVSNSGLPANFGVLSLLTVGNDILATGATFSGSLPIQAGLYKSTNNGQSWTAVSAGLSNFLSVNALLQHHNKLYLSATTGFTNSILMSENNGQSWITASASPASNFVGNDSEVLGDSIFLAGFSINVSFTAGLYQSPDLSTSWEQVPIDTLPDFSTATAILNHEGKLFLAVSSGTDENSLLSSFINHSPTVINPIANQSFTEGFGSETIDISTTFTDADGDALSFSVSSTNETVVTASLSGNSIIIQEVGLGTSTIRLTADDGKTGTATAIFSVTVTALPNTIPTLVNPISDQVFNEGFTSHTIDISNTFNDLDNEPLSFSVTSSNENIATISITANMLTINEVNTGTTTIILTADDLNGGTAKDTFSVTVNEIVGLQQNDFEALTIYPNPTDGKLQLNVGEVITGRIQLRDVLGKIIFEQTLHKQQQVFFVITAPQGMYLLSIESQNGKRTAIPVIKQ